MYWLCLEEKWDLKEVWEKIYFKETVEKKVVTCIASSRLLAGSRERQVKGGKDLLHRFLAAHHTCRERDPHTETPATACVCLVYRARQRIPDPSALQPPLHRRRQILSQSEKNLIYSHLPASSTSFWPSSNRNASCSLGKISFLLFSVFPLCQRMYLHKKGPN